jgi:succinate dehydrogenase/fumarate reductase cytochrome b subunit
MVIWAGAFLWPVISDGTAALHRPSGVAIFLFYLFFGASNLLTAAILLFSKQFSYEFTKRRESAPKYIGHLRLLLIGAIVAAMLIATFYDIVRLVNSP